MTRVRLLLAGAVTFVVLPLAILVRLGWDPLADADRSADDGAHRSLSGHATAVGWVRGATHLGDPLVVTALAMVIAAGCWVSRRRTEAVYVLAVRALAVALGFGLKEGVARARPNLAEPIAHASGYSFPSGHALGAAATYLSVALVVSGVRPRAGRVAVPLAVVVALVVATTRVLLGVHFPSDVVAGLVLGWAVALLVYLPAERLVSEE
ncbi:MAG TPA: phosphatase PAP2 family protein [Mycobacteriales bacterium]|nr:phosphatase PAP2 family protein [Mycobacteriales bacterium]